MKAHIKFIISWKHNNFFQWDLKPVINQHSSNEAYYITTGCNSDLEAEQRQRSPATLGERLVRSRLPLNPAERQEAVSRPTSPSTGMDFNPGICTATLALSLIQTKTLNIAAHVTFGNDRFPIVRLSGGWTFTSRSVEEKLPKPKHFHRHEVQLAKLVVFVNDRVL